MDKNQSFERRIRLRLHWACGHGRPDATVLLAASGLVFFDPCPERLGTNCVKAGTADLSAYFHSVRISPYQAVKRMDAAGAWSTISRRVADDYGVSIEWVN